MCKCQLKTVNFELKIADWKFKWKIAMYHCELKTEN